jgi:probable F420-dependent oxidoreductase
MSTRAELHGPEISMGMQITESTDLGLMRCLEGAGAKAFWVGGHVSSPYTSPEVIVRLAGLIEQTETVLVGTGILLLPLYPPGLISKQLADLDRASKGRVVVGVGVGGEQEGDFGACEVPMSQRGSRANEAIPLLRRFWTAEPVSHSGRHFHFDEVRIHPAPVQTGGPPIIVSGRQAAAMRRAALLGDGWMPYMYSARRYKESVDTIRSIARETGRDLSSFQWIAYLIVSMDDDPMKARRRAIEALGASYPQDFDEIIDKVAVVGTPSDVKDKLQAYVDAGARHLIVGPTHGEQLMEEILPTLRIPNDDHVASDHPLKDLARVRPNPEA